jgi:hypothetical protein
MDCQKSDWKTTHKAACSVYQAAYPNKCVVQRMAIALRKLGQKSQTICESMLDGTNILLFQYVGLDAKVKTSQMALYMEGTLAHLELSRADFVILTPGAEVPKPMENVLQCSLIARDSAHAEEARKHPIKGQKFVFEIRSWIGKQGPAERQTVVRRQA